MLQWIKRELNPRPTTSDEALYQFMASQSGYSLAEVYVPFDATKRGHWCDRAQILDFAETTGGGDLLDVGPGDGWPSLPVARMARSVTGIDASALRIAVCEENARRMGITNFRGALYAAGGALPFADATFDGVMASSALEQAPDPQALLREIHRVLKPGGTLRFRYEAPYSHGGEVQSGTDMWAIDDATTFVYVQEYNWAEERATYYSLVIAAPLAEVKPLVATPEQLRPLVRDCMTYSLHLPGARTWLTWVREAGFSRAVTTYGGLEYAMGIFSQLPPEQRPQDLAGFDALLRPGIRAITRWEAPEHLNLPITAVK